MDLKEPRITHILKLLAVSDNAPVYREDKKWVRSLHPYQPDYEAIAARTRTRRHEWGRMRDYIRTPDCLMRFLATELDDDTAEDCGRCANCRGENLFEMTPDPRTVQAAVRWVRGHSSEILEPRKVWPARDALPEYGWHGKIRTPNEVGRALSVWGDPGWATMVREGKEHGRFDDQLIAACVELVRAHWLPAGDGT